MKKLTLTIIITLVLATAGAYAQGVSFYEGTLQEALDLAKKENKKVFMDVYTTWCAPCKKMTKEVFPVKKVGDFYNANFVSMKIDAEKGEGVNIAQQYEVAGYPSLIYLDTEGKIIKKVTRYLDVDALYQTGEEVVKSKDNIVELQDKYKKGTISHEELYIYLNSLRNKELTGEAEEVFNKYFAVEVKKEITPKLLNEIYGCALSSENPSFQYLVKNREAFYQKIDKKKVDEIIHTFYLSEFRNKTWEKAFAFFDEFKTGRDRLAEAIDLDEETSLSLESDFYYAHRSEDEYFEVSAVLIKKYYSQDDLQISNIIGGGTKIATKKKHFKTLKKWAEQALAIKENSLNLATLAITCLKLQENELSDTYFAKAIEVSKRDKDGYHENIKYLKEYYTAQAKESGSK